MSGLDEVKVSSIICPKCLEHAKGNQNWGIRNNTSSTPLAYFDIIPIKKMCQMTLVHKHTQFSWKYKAGKSLDWYNLSRLEIDKIVCNRGHRFTKNDAVFNKLMYAIKRAISRGEFVYE